MGERLTRARRGTRSVAGSMFLGCRCHRASAVRAAHVGHVGRWSFLGKSARPSRSVASQAGCTVHTAHRGTLAAAKKNGQGARRRGHRWAGGEAANGRAGAKGGGRRPNRQWTAACRVPGLGKCVSPRCRWRGTCAFREPATTARAVSRLPTTIHIHPTTTYVAFFLDITIPLSPTPTTGALRTIPVPRPSPPHGIRLSGLLDSIGRFRLSRDHQADPLLGTALGLVGITAPPQQLVSPVLPIGRPSFFTMPVPATLTSYLPVLLVSVTHSTAPDDTSYSTLPEGQVDYLSHEWREEDVWRSWRSMTRQKNAIANGTRLENASWRTWWKQRNKLKTISPETLNWLKDSDVTWLYGPLHIGTDWSPTASRRPESPALQRQNSMSAIHNASRATTNRAPVTKPKKPILKRRSISQLLSLPASPWFEQGESDEEDVTALQGGENHNPKRPPLLHTKSDTHISLRGRAHRKDSPPRIIAEEGAAAPAPTVRDASVVSRLSGASSDVSQSTTNSDPDLSGGSSIESPAASDPGLKKKHISFNTFVEQCIAIEKPKSKRQATGPRRSPVSSLEDGYDSEATNEDESEEPMEYYRQRQSIMNSDSDDDEDEDDVLEMRTSSSRSRTSSAPGAQPSMPSPAFDSPRTPHPHFRPALVRRASVGPEHVTIAPIAPTLLKGTGVGNNLASPGLPAPVTKDLELVYAPPSNSNYSLPGSPSRSQEDVYRHRESYFSVGTSPSPEARSPLASPPIATVNALPPPSQLSSSPPKYEAAARSFYPQPYPESPMHMDTVAEDAFDYFDGAPVLNENYHSAEWSDQHRAQEQTHVDAGAAPARYAEGGAESVQVGRSSGHAESPPAYSYVQSPETPVVVVNEVNGAMEERTERSREPSPAHTSSDDLTHSPTFVHSAPVAVPRIGATHPQITFSPHVANATLLSPSLSPCRGRTSASPTCASVSGSTTTGPSSYSRSTDSRSDSRGRSLTRSGSFSDRERSSSRGTSSPMGSLSPTGSALALGTAGAHARGKERGRRMGSEESDRGRDRTGRALAASVSPPCAVDSPMRGEREGSDCSVASADVSPAKCEPSSPPSSVSGSSTASASTARPAQDATGASRPRIAVHTGPTIPRPIPSPIPEEEELRRTSHPTPANSPVATLKASITSPTTKSDPQPTALTSTSHAEGEISTTSPIAIPRKDRTPRPSLEGQQDGTFAGRAADMMSSARGLLGSIWNTGTA
ncbi:hypothetical protein DAEQUDRAFT_691197 [Daedalea quercina L-15889]|uniref:Nitrogen regulatory protein areA GATA-like domain-containing protein n=1 Tax=Daedalea quercina L-15889 TaxID=1314783 RepID=A0A165QDJ4_9APHY|nr:hypothetical protein DAEQUDRAFT_691197 [Daedalea quercina L-15889]